MGFFRYLNDVVIQHHDTIVTSSDLGLAVTCQYDLTNKTVANEVDLGIHGDIQTGLSEEVIVDSPNVAMRITDRNGDDTIASAEVGDPLVILITFISNCAYNFVVPCNNKLHSLFRHFASRSWIPTHPSKYLCASLSLWTASTPARLPSLTAMVAPPSTSSWDPCLNQLTVER